MTTAYDLDGTIIVSPFKHYAVKKLVWKYNSHVDRPDVTTIVTSRNVKDAELTWLTCKLCGLKYLTTIIFNPEKNWNKNYVAKWKADTLTRYNISEYVDGNQTDLDMMKKYYRGKLTWIKT